MSVQTLIRRVKQQYQGDEDRPLGGYLAVLGVYGGVTGGLTVLARSLRITPPRRASPTPPCCRWRRTS
ncbi:hypothetical protein [Kutzneria kofuensis]|uniref:hypothetical protein n=1 Tax=Kutzneria kofuensis TaxID=103725 RepID=UPI0031E54BE0